MATKRIKVLDFWIAGVYDEDMVEKNQVSLGEMLRVQRITRHLTLKQLSTMARVSPSHLTRIEKGSRFPSAHVLNRLAGPLGFEENELFTLAGYLSPVQEGADSYKAYDSSKLDPYVARTLAQEPPEVQKAVIGILVVLKSLSRGLTSQTPQD